MSDAAITHTGSGSLILGQDQDCLGGCFAPDQAFSGVIDEVKLLEFAITDADKDNDLP